MKIAYWQSQRQVSTVDHMAAIGIALSINYYRKVVLLDNEQGGNSLERVFRGIQRFYYVKEDSDYIVHRHGMDRILNNFYNTSELEQLLARSTVEVIQNYLYYVPQSKVINHLAYEYQLYHELVKIMRIYEQISEFTIVRAQNGNNLSTKHVLEEADLVMVELTQDYNVLEEFFDNYDSLREKAIYVFSQYKQNSISIYQIMKKYHLSKEQVIVLTEHEPLNAAYLSGNLVSYLKINNNCKKESEHYRCVRELRRAAKILVSYERRDVVETVT